MNRRPARSAASNSGFTMIEALIATALMVAILTALATVTAQWLPNWNRGFARVQRSELLSFGLERIVSDLAAAEFVPPHNKTKDPLFDGGEISVTFVRSALGPNARPGLEVIRLAEVSEGNGLTMVRLRAPFVPLEPTLPVNPQLKFFDPVMLVRAPYRITFAYAGPDRVWKTTWRESNQLPRAVRILLRDAATDQTLSVSTATMVHVVVGAECVRSRNPRDCNKVQAAPPASNL
ncbi:MAG: ral secretion pathway protein [Alphaproteobacteria bacterium]|jgi:general secretion pathway protein J|nr:ral secretion pathway protein [Alphaproteobacteria bacterium]